jgi:sensor c-di-GMP phosphodiesterase-like protein
MLHSLKLRILVTLLATGFGAACGALAGYQLGCAIALRQTQARLDQFAQRIMNEGQTSTAESRAVLAKMNTSPYAFCSDTEIAYFRQMVFESKYLKGAGRMRDGRIDCSTNPGNGKASTVQFKPAFFQKDGTTIYQNLPPFRIGDQTVISVQLGDSFVVYSPFVLRTPISRFMHFTITDVDASNLHAGRLLGDSPQVQGPFLIHDGEARADGHTFATRCSPDGAVCVTAFSSIPEALRLDRSNLLACTAMGALTGSALGFFCSFLYRRSRSLAQQLRRAIRQDKLGVVYQPIVGLSDRRIVGVEALARWTDEGGSPVSPEVFIRLAEERGFVGEITELVVRHSLRDFADTLRSHPDFRVSFNIAAADLLDSRLLPMLERSLADANVAPQSLAIEITESSTARYVPAMMTIRGLRERGFHVHIDDFGTGYSSLAYLQDLAVDAIKIDRTFTKAIGTDSVTVSILPQILTMVETLNLDVIVEGIETPEQADYFAGASQTIYAQGWLFGRPCAAAKLLGTLTEQEHSVMVA